jgi:hypothetical protein
VQVQPGQSRSWQASSESCHSSGNWWVRSVDSEEAGRADSAPKSLIVAEAEAVSLAEGSIRATGNARSSGAAGVPSPGHAFTGILQELGRPSCLLLQDRVRSARQQGTGPWLVGMHRPRERRSIQWEVNRAVKGDRRLPGRAWEESYDPIVPRKVGNCRKAGPTGGKG